MPVSTEKGFAKAVAPLFAAPLHETQMDVDVAAHAKSPPMFTKSLDSTEEELTFKVTSETVSNQIIGVEITPVVTESVATESQAPEGATAGIEEVKEEYVSLEVKAELKWAKS